MKRLNVFIITFVFAFLYCVAAKSSALTDIGVKPISTLDGFSLSFSEIPQEVNRIFLYIDEHDKPNGSNIVFADVRGESLERLKKSSVLRCPFVHERIKYNIIIFFYFNNGQEIQKTTAIVAAGGTRLINSPQLFLNDNFTGAALSMAPVFSSDVEYTPDRYSYQVTVHINESSSIGYGTRSDLLSYDFSSMKDDFIKDGLEINGKFSADVTAFCNLIYENITWAVGIAKSKKFTVSM